MPDIYFITQNSPYIHNQHLCWNLL